MGQHKCMNEACRATTSSEWKNGWTLNSGGFAILCSDCGSAYANCVFCEMFHHKESGWKECRLCSKRIHCGCIASRYLYEYMDFGGIACKNCAKRSEAHPAALPEQIPTGKFNVQFLAGGIIRGTPVAAVENRIIVDKYGSKVPNAIKVNDAASELKNKNVKQGEPSGIPKIKLKPDVDNKKGLNQQEQSTNNASTNPQKLNLTTNKEANVVSKIPIARPPPEGRRSIHLLPRYWPQISDHELQQLSGMLKSSITPLFEKVLSASDAGRIGRLVLPKACAEAYLPTINHSEGVSIRVQDTTGIQWTFQFRFWPNNNSRMYVLEGITDCIQNMQLQAGDTVIFSRIESKGGLLLSSRKATFDVNMQDVQKSGGLNREKTSMETSFPGGAENKLPDNGNNGGRVSDDVQQHVNTLPEKKRTQNIKNKRLHMHNDDAAELRITWKEAQELLRPSPFSEPAIVTIEGHEFEEFEEPPIFGQRMLSITQPARCSASAPESINQTDPECFSLSNELKNIKFSDNKASIEEYPEPALGLDALASAAALGDELPVGETARHPRHRPGCTCIVCIQPRSRKGKQDLTIIKMVSKQKSRRQPEHNPGLVPEKESTAQPGNQPNLDEHHSETGNNQVKPEPFKGRIDLNLRPHDGDVLEEPVAPEPVSDAGR
ncbi:B3 domain-containing transcription repressor VAL1-like isoform X2 [Andrographis paniculata]|uniref:B3 domain-containing transcription repressor VAL1-like isoform X2 n=1 Tax=Andrographis paniculata TaxID=175694 RepID=UPI0021E70D17|nr:B3 domain-containing transcription repressor VAL1-like isoform X2 [Andrographis paniculata]